MHCGNAGETGKTYADLCSGHKGGNRKNESGKMNRKTKNRLRTVISVAVATQLLSIFCFRHSLIIGGEILIPVLILLIKQAAIKIMGIFTGITDKSGNTGRKE